jgi:hypothetical protein
MATKNHSSVQLKEVTPSQKWVIQDLVHDELVGTLSLSGRSQNAFIEVRSFGPFSEGDQTGAAWQYGPIQFEEWVVKTFFELFGAKEAIVLMQGGEMPTVSDFFREYYLPM